VVSLDASRLEETSKMLTVGDRLALAQGLSVRGSAIRRRFEPLSSMSHPIPAGIQRNELPVPRTGLRLVDLERARDQHRALGTPNR
jgi:hypothetical protein